MSKTKGQPPSIWRAVSLPLFLGLHLVACTTLASDELVYSQTCDGSAGAPVGTWLIECNDETSTLLVRDRDQSQGPSTAIELAPLLKIPLEDQETDIEGATTLNGETYWIGSHSTNKQGIPQPRRRTLFATQIKNAGTGPVVSIVGKPYTHLLEDLKSYAATNSLGFNVDEAANTSPDKNGLNVEGLAAWQSNLLVGFRGPIIDGKALVIEIGDVPNALQANKAQIVRHMWLDLGGRGIRSIEFFGSKGFVIAAGGTGDDEKFALYTWKAPGATNVTPVNVDLGDLRPEGIVVYPDRSDRIQLLSDDGDIRGPDGKKCKNVTNKSHRSRWIQIP